MDLSVLYKEREQLKSRLADEMYLLRKEYQPKIDALTKQIVRQNEKGIKKRLNKIKSNTGKFFQ